MYLECQKAHCYSLSIRELYSAHIGNLMIPDEVLLQPRENVVKFCNPLYEQGIILDLSHQKAFTAAKKQGH